MWVSITGYSITGLLGSLVWSPKSRRLHPCNVAMRWVMPPQFIQKSGYHKNPKTMGFLSNKLMDNPIVYPWSFSPQVYRTKSTWRPGPHIQQRPHRDRQDELWGLRLHPITTWCTIAGLNMEDGPPFMAKHPKFMWFSLFSWVNILITSDNPWEFGNFEGVQFSDTAPYA